MIKIKRALISVSDKTGVESFAQALAELGVEILSTGGTARALSAAGINVTDVSEYTGSPEMMDGRLKTLHPKIHGGLLGRRGRDDAEMTRHGIGPIDLVAVNLYPFQETIARADCTFEQAVDNIDIGGPTMLRAAAKNYTDVTVVVDPLDYRRVVDRMREHGGSVDDALRFELATKAFAHTAQYDGAISNYLGSLTAPSSERAHFPRSLSLQFCKVEDLRYGENPHQAAAFYRDPVAPAGTIASATKLQGKPLSYNNIADADAAWECAKSFDTETVCVIVKHANPCGVGTADNLLTAYDRAYATDPTSAFGGIIAFNRPLDAHTAQAIIDRQFVEVIIAPTILEEAQTVLANKRNVRVLAAGQAITSAEPPALSFTRVGGGLLVQDADSARLEQDKLRCVTQRAPSTDELGDLLFAWKVAKFVKSNAIVYAHGGRTVGIGAGQMSRVDSARLAEMKAREAGLDLHGAAMASDAFFPFRDAVDRAAEAGIAAIIQPGGSIHDEEVIQAADERGLAMVFTGIRHFRH